MAAQFVSFAVAVVVAYAIAADAVASFYSDFATAKVVVAVAV